MPSLADHQSQSVTKLLLIGDSGTGKTGSLVSLVEAGYTLRILDMDNGLSALVQKIKERCPDKIGNVEFETLRDNVKSSPMGPSVQPTAFVKALKLLDKWSDGSEPRTWGDKVVFVLDSLTFFADTAFNWAKGMNPTSKDPRQWYGAAQSAVEDVLALLTSGDFKTNVIVMSHVSWIERPDGSMKGYPSSVGKALGPTIPAYFDNVALMETTGTGSNVKRTMRTQPTALIDLKNPAALRMAPALPIDSALADFFKTVQA